MRLLLDLSSALLGLIVIAPLLEVRYAGIRWQHDTFRSNQTREGQIREEALVRVRDENRPRYPNIKWYLDSIGLDFAEVIKVVNAIPRLHAG